MSAVPSVEKLKLLESVELFAGFSQSQLEGVSRVALTKALERRAELFHKGDEGGEVYIVVSGKLKALTTSVGGDDVVFSIIGPGEVFGEVALFGETRRTASISAIENCVLLVINRRDFMSFLHSNPEVAVNLLSLLARRLKAVSELVEDTLFLNLPLRLAKKLLALSRLYGEEGPDGLRVDLKLSQEEWGDLVGATRESVNKQVRQWTGAGVIRVDKGYVVILNKAELEKFSGVVLD